MVATLPFNRVAAQFDAPEPDLPKSARGRGQLWSDTVFQAVLALKKQLRSPDARLATAAATTIIDLEQTRMRHSSTLAGSEEVSDAQLEFEEEQRGETEAEPKSTGDPALARHARAARTAMEKTGCSMTEAQSVQFTAGLLANLGKEAGEVSSQDFAETLRELGASIEQESRTDSPTVPSRSTPCDSADGGRPKSGVHFAQASRNSATYNGV